MADVMNSGEAAERKVVPIKEKGLTLRDVIREDKHLREFLKFIHQNDLRERAINLMSKRWKSKG